MLDDSRHFVDSSAAAAGIAGELAEEKKTIALIVATLNSSNAFYASGAAKTALFPDTPPVVPAEAADFLNLLLAVLSSAAAHARSSHHVMSPSGLASPRGSAAALGQTPSSALLQLLFDGPYNIIDTLTALVAPSRKTYIPLPGGAGVAMMQSNEVMHEFTALRTAALRTIKTIVAMCHEHSDGEKKHLLSLIHAATLRTSLFQHLAYIVCSPTAPESCRLAATECLFVLCMRCGLDIALWSSLFEPILKAVAVESSAPIRAFSCAILRQYIVSHPEAEVVRSNLPVLAKLLATDSSYDVKSLCAQSVEAIMAAASSRSGEESVASSLLIIAEVAHTSLDRSISETRSSTFFESGHVSRAQAADLHEALSKLLQACLLFATHRGGSDEARVFRLFLRGNTQDVILRAVGSATTPATAIAAAHLLRLFVERSMTQMCAEGGKDIALGVLGRMVEATAVGTLVKSLMSIDPRRDGAGASADDMLKWHVAATEITIAIGLLLLFSPQSRLMFTTELQRYPSWIQGLPQRLHQALSSTDLAYFSDMLIVDDAGLLVNDPQSVVWDDSAHPSQASVQCVVDAQEMGRRQNVPRITHAQLQLLRGSSDPRRGYLAFVLLGYIFFYVFRHEEKRPAAAEGRSPIGANNNTSAALGLMPDRRHGAEDSQRLRQRAVEVAEEVHAEVESEREPLFPNPNSRNSPLRRKQPHEPHPQQQQHFDLLRTEFDAAFKLATELAQHYHRNVLQMEVPARLTHAGPPPIRSSKVRNPYEVIAQTRPSQRRTWTVHAVREGDLFFLFVPIAALNTSVIGAVVAKARRHHVSAKKAFVTTPQAHKERRWFLLDLHTIIMPRIIALLQTLQKLLITQGDEHVQVAVSVLPSIRTASGDKAVYGANLVNVVDYLSHYFSLNIGAAAARADREAFVDPGTLLANEIMGGSARRAVVARGGDRQGSLGRQLFEVSSSSSSSSPIGSSRSSGSSSLEDRY